MMRDADALSADKGDKDGASPRHCLPGANRSITVAGAVGSLLASGERRLAFGAQAGHGETHWGWLVE